MGDRHYTNTSNLGVEVCVNALQEAWLRDEVYMQLIKQLTDNDNSDSVKQGWNLMCVCLRTFAPSSEFENYLEMWLKKQAKHPDEMIHLLHPTIYDGKTRRAPSESDFEKMMKEGWSVAVKPDYAEVKKYETPVVKCPPKGQANAFAIAANAAANAADSSVPPSSAPPAIPGAAPAVPETPPVPSNADDEFFGAGAAPPPPPPAPVLECKWAEAVTEDGETYYYNVDTMETTWDKPEGMP